MSYGFFELSLNFCHQSVEKNVDKKIINKFIKGGVDEINENYCIKNFEEKLRHRSDKIIRLLIRKKKKIEEYIKAIQNGEFEATPGLFTCKFCDFNDICEESEAK